MTYDKNESNSEGSGRFEGREEGFGRGRWGRGPYGNGGFERGFNRSSDNGGDWLNWARQPGFHPLKAVATVGAFALFPPLGVLTLGYFLWTSRRGWGPAYAGQGFEGRGFGGRCGGGHRGMGRWSTGNDVFDAHQREQFMKMREERHAFHDYRMAEKKKRDQQAFDDFKAAEAAKPAEEKKSE